VSVAPDLRPLVTLGTTTALQSSEGKRTRSAGPATARAPEAARQRSPPATQPPPPPRGAPRPQPSPANPQQDQDRPGTSAPGHGPSAGSRAAAIAPSHATTSATSWRS